MMMLKPLRLTLFLSLFLVGCGTQIALSGQARDDYLKSIKAYGEYWVKPEASVEQRREDSWECGTARTVHAADHVVFTAEQEQNEKRPEEKDEFAARTRLSRAWVKCMRAKGYEYHYTGPR